MKRFLTSICVALMIVLTGCDGKEITETPLDDGIRYAEKYEMVSLSESGILYAGDDGIVHLVTIDEGRDIAFCYNPNCTHPDARATYGDPECMAALYYGECEVAYYEGAVYFFVGDGLFEHRLYRMDTSGSGRTLLAKLPFSFHTGYAVVFREDKMYYTAQIPYVDEITAKVNYMSRIVEVDIIDGSYRFVSGETNNIFTVIDLAGDYIYTRIADVNYNGYFNMVRIDMNTLEEEIVIPAETWVNGYNYIDPKDEDSYYYWDRQTFELGVRNIDGTVEEILVKGAEGENFGGAEFSGNGLYYHRIYDYENEPAGHYFMVLSTGEVTDITEEGEKYKIVGYDGHYDVFISREFDDKLNYMKWGLYSRDKIFKEAGVD